MATLRIRPTLGRVFWLTVLDFLQGIFSEKASRDQADRELAVEGFDVDREAARVRSRKAAGLPAYPD